jgi:hypothetical protein
MTTIRRSSPFDEFFGLRLATDPLSEDDLVWPRPAPEEIEPKSIRIQAFTGEAQREKEPVGFGTGR